VFERLYILHKTYSVWGLDEVIVLILVLALGLAVFSWRRWRDLKREVARRQGVEATLRASLDFYLTLFEDFSAMIWRAGLDAKCDYFNRAWLEFTGRALAQEQGDGWAEGVHADDLAGCLDVYRNAFAAQQPFSMKYRLRRHDGVYRWILDMGRPYADLNGVFAGYIGSCYDISVEVEAEQELLTYQSRLKELTAELTLAEERERRRIAMELHDQVAQNLAFTKMKISTLMKVVDGDAGVHLCKEINELVGESIQDIRTLTLDLSPPVLYELGFEAALAWLGERFQQEHGLRVLFSDDRCGESPGDEIRVMLFKVAREALVNVAKHARATTVALVVTRDDRFIKLQIEDDGVGFDPDQSEVLRRQSSFGLFSMQERVQQLGGVFTVDTAPGKGTSITVLSPLQLAVQLKGQRQ
jgi:PAS domain S-box-containing protein